MSCPKCACTCPLKVGDAVRYKRKYGDNRLSGAEVRTVTYVSDEWVGYKALNCGGEQMMTRKAFEEKMEKDG